MVAPPKAFGGDFDRCWLLAVQLYGVRSARNWGIGDFTDLERLIELASHLGADGVGLNPLHALFDDRPGDCSPYSPNSRLFLNALYVDPAGIPEFRQDEATRDALAQARAGDVVDYVAVAGLKWRALRSAFEAFRRDATQAHRQLASAKDRAHRLGMKVGLYLDVAVGVQSDGFDAWNEQAAISRLLGVGAPPDPLNTAGQSWGLAGFNATGLELKSFEPYREMLRASMRHAGAIRLAHVLGLK